ncbi:hypothetical protein ACSBR2_010120 [Camellia fascicularis]
MAVELCSENSSPGLITSPRISFSHDLSQSDIVPIEQRVLRSNSSSGIDFNFCIRDGYDQQSSSADELFSDGKILPIQIKKKMALLQQTHQPPPPPPPPPQTPDHHIVNKTCETSNNEGLKEAKLTSSGSDEKQNSKSFWRFKRSSSLNCGSGYGRSLCPLPLLSRSNSTGSANHHHTHKHNSQKNSSSVSASKPSSQFSGSHQKPPLKKSYASHGNGVRVNPVLNVPSGNLFGLGSIFFNGKDKNKKK